MSQVNAITLQAGAATADLTPPGSVFLFGYPHMQRYSTGVHDRLETNALFLRSGPEAVLFIANDLIFVGKALATDVRRRISAKTGIPASAIAVTATHTHSGPMTVEYLSNSADRTVPKLDPEYLAFVAERLVSAGCAAVHNAEPAEIGLVVAMAEGVGTNRHDPTGPADSDVPVWVVRSARSKTPLACMLAYAMHPTVLHEDSTLISADFPGFTRQRLRAGGVLPPSCPILYHNGASGNQSPRHVTRANTFAEARRLGEGLGESIARAMTNLKFSPKISLENRTGHVQLRLREFPPVELALNRSVEARRKFESLRDSGAPRAAVRTAECDWFGAEETLELTRAALDGRLNKVARDFGSFEIQVIVIGVWKIVMWPGEFFVEYGLAVKAASPETFVVTMANGELQGYIVTPDAVTRGLYEATNAMFCASNGQRVVDATIALLNRQT